MLKKFRSVANDWIVNQNKKFPNNKSFKSLTMCKKCYTFYYKKSWHFERPKELDREDVGPIPVSFTECPSCVEQELAVYDWDSTWYA